MGYLECTGEYCYMFFRSHQGPPLGWLKSVKEPDWLVRGESFDDHWADRGDCCPSSVQVEASVMFTLALRARFCCYCQWHQAWYNACLWRHLMTRDLRALVCPLWCRTASMIRTEWLQELFCVNFIPDPNYFSSCSAQFIQVLLFFFFFFRRWTSFNWRFWPSQWHLSTLLYPGHRLTNFWSSFDQGHVWWCPPIYIWVFLLVKGFHLNIFLAALARFCSLL